MVIVLATDIEGTYTMRYPSKSKQSDLHEVHEPFAQQLEARSLVT